jgi:hypothetical protein
VDVADSAYKHGVADEDIDHAIAHAEVTKVLRPGDPLVFITIGPDRGDQLLELIWFEFEDRDLLVHAMGLRRKFRHLLPKGHRR